MFKVFLAFLGLIRLSYQHARLMEPPSRASMWRVGFPTPKDIDDNQNYCGGFGVQFGQNGGKCGICGDPWHDFPREHEAPDGIYATGKLIKNFWWSTVFENHRKKSHSILRATFTYFDGFFIPIWNEFFNQLIELYLWFHLHQCPLQCRDFVDLENSIWSNFQDFSNNCNNNCRDFDRHIWKLQPIKLQWWS